MSDAHLLIIDDHPVVRNGMAEVIGQYEGLQISGRAESAEEGFQLYQENEYDLAIVDLALEGLDGLDLIKKITAQQTDFPVLVLSMQDETLYAERAVGAGARGYVSKDEAIPTVVEAIRTVLRGNLYLSEAVSKQMVHRFAGDVSKDAPSSPIERLSDREIEVFHLLGEGHGTQATAEKLNISPKTVESHRASIKEKLNLEDATALMQRAVLWVQETKQKPAD